MRNTRAPRATRRGLPAPGHTAARNAVLAAGLAALDGGAGDSAQESGSGTVKSASWSFEVNWPVTHSGYRFLGGALT